MSTFLWGMLAGVGLCILVTIIYQAGVAAGKQRNEKDADQP